MRTRHVWITVAFVMTFQMPAIAQLTPPLYNVYGYGRDAAGRPLSGVIVHDRSSSTLTDSSGRFDLPQREFGSIPLTASRSDLDSRTDYVNVNVPQDTRHDFEGLLYRISMTLDKTYVSTTDGAATITVNVITWAPFPGVQGEAGNSCVTVTDIRTSTTVDAEVVGQNSDGSYSWRLPISMPASSSEGSYKAIARAVSCDSGVVLTRQVSASYMIDNTPVFLMDPLPIWGNASPVVSAEARDGSGSGIPLNGASISVDGVAYPTSVSGGRVLAQPTGLKDGVRFVEVRVTDRAGNQSSLTYTFNVDTTAPSLTDQSPEGSTTDRSPELKIRAAAGDSGLDPTSIQMTITGPEDLRSAKLAASYEPNTGWITYQIPAEAHGLDPGESPLLPGRYSVQVEVTNKAGTQSIKEWQFLVVLVSI